MSNFRDKSNDEQDKAAFLELMTKKNGNAYAAYTQLGIPWTRIYAWKKEDPEFDAKMKEIKKHEVKWVEDRMHKLIEDGNYNMIQFFLKTQAKDEYGDTQKIEVTTGTNVEQALESLAAQVSGAENKSLDQIKAAPEESK